MNSATRIPEPLEELQTHLAQSSPWRDEQGCLWLTSQSPSLRPLAETMNQIGARFITITAAEDAASGALSLDYHWDLNGLLLGVRIPAPDKALDSIADLCPAADWIEREIHDGWALLFLGRDLEPLLLRPSDPAGVNLLKEAE